jgi:hypothetical protein
MMKMVCGFLILNLIAFGCSSKKQEKGSTSAELVNEYPPLVLQFENGERLSAKDLKGKNVFVLFQPDCSHCQEEAIHIEQRLPEFKDYTLYFISSSPIDQIMAFARGFNLDAREKVRFAWTAPEGVLTYYGPIQTPSIYIYSDGKLRQKFNGQTEIESILRAL